MTFPSTCVIAASLCLACRRHLSLLLQSSRRPARDAQSTAIKRAAPPAKLAQQVGGPRRRRRWVPIPAVSGKDAYLILDATSGRELVADRPDELRHPASLTKLMTIYLTFSALDSRPAVARRRACRCRSTPSTRRRPRWD